MDFAHSPRALDLRAQLQRFMDDLVLPSLADWHRWADAGLYPSDVVEPLKARARELGLWNLCLPNLPEGAPGTRLSNLDYAPLAEVMGPVPWSAEVFNCNAPDSGTMELLLQCATPAQAERWLQPLLAPPTPQATAAAYPRGAVFAGEALRELAAADWQGRLGAPEIDTLQRWATALAQPSARERLGALPGATMTAATSAMAGDGAVHDRLGPGRATGVSGHRSDPHAPASAPDTGPGAAQDAIEALGPLTAREAEVLALVARGQSNKLIARALDLSPHTVKRHVANLLDKLAVASRSQAAAWYHAQRPAVPPRRR